MLAQINSSFVDGILCSSGGVDRMIQLQGIYLGAIELRTLNTHVFCSAFRNCCLDGGDNHVVVITLYE